jgi:hypothetical protein
MEGLPESGVLGGDRRGPPPAPATGFALSFPGGSAGAPWTQDSR